MQLQFPPHLPPLRDRLRYQRPKARRVVHLLQVAHLMHDNIILQMLRQKDDTVVEAQMPALRTAPPAGFLVAHAEGVVGKRVERFEVGNFPLDEMPGSFLA